MTRTKEQIEAEIAALQAELAKVDDEPDWEAWRPALDAYYNGDPAFWGCEVDMCEEDKNAILGLIAAAPLMPTAAMTDAEIEELAEEAVRDPNWFGTRTSARLAIRATIARLGHGRKAWPSEAELREMAQGIRDDMWADKLKHGNSSFADAALEMARRLREFGA